MDTIVTNNSTHVNKIKLKAELFRITWDDVRLESRTILIRSAKKGGLTFREIPIIDDAFLGQLALWRNQDQGDGYVIHYKRKPIKSIKTAWKAAKRRAGVTRRLRMYDCRHAFASELLAKGGDLKAVSEMLGHSDVSMTTKIYQHTSRALLEKTIKNMPSLFGTDLVHKKDVPGGS